MKTVKVIALVSALGLLAWMAATNSIRGKADAVAATNAEKVVTRALREDPEMKLKLGNLVSLSGSGHRRPGAWVLIERIELDRVANFERGTVSVNIVVPGTPKTSVESGALGIQQWRLSEGFSHPHGHSLEVWVGPKTPQRGAATGDPSKPAPKEASSSELRLSAATLSADGGHIFLGYDRMVEVWDRANRTLIRKLAGFYGRVQAIEPSADGTKLAVACDNGSVRVLDIVTGALTGSASWHANGTHPVALSREGSLLVSTMFDLTRAQIGVATQLPAGAKVALVDPEAGPDAAATGFWLSPDGRYVVATQERLRKVQAWELETGKSAGSIRLDSRPYGRLDLAFTPRSGRLISCSLSADLNLSIVEIPSWKKSAPFEAIPQISQLETTESVVTVNADETLLAVGMVNGSVFLWDMNSFKRLDTIEEEGWTLEGPIANPTGISWEQAKGTGLPKNPSQGDFNQPIGSHGPKRPARPLVSLCFDRTNRLVGLSLSDRRIGWIWSATPPRPKTANIRPEPENAASGSPGAK